ncbi:MAG: FAD-binding protein [Saezia sp.]
MNKVEKVWVLSDSADKYPVLLSGAKEMADDVAVIWVGAGEQAQKIATQGASQVHWIEPAPSEMMESYARAISELIASDGKKALVLISATRRGKAMAAKLSVLLEAGCVNDVAAIFIHEDGSASAQHMVFGGLALGKEKLSSKLMIATVGNNTFEQKALSSQAQVVKMDAKPHSAGIVCKERLPKQESRVDLTVAKRIVGVGRGLNKQEDLGMIEELSRAIGAEMACSRPIAESEKWMTHDRYIGVTGVQVAPDVYLAVGISGQVQHMVGVSSAQTIFAINKDKSAPIFEQADYGIVGDLYKIIPALVSALK